MAETIWHRRSLIPAGRERGVESACGAAEQGNGYAALRQCVDVTALRGCEVRDCATRNMSEETCDSHSIRVTEETGTGHLMIDPTCSSSTPLHLDRDGVLGLRLRRAARVDERRTVDLSDVVRIDHSLTYVGVQEGDIVAAE